MLLTHILYNDIPYLSHIVHNHFLSQWSLINTFPFDFCYFTLSTDAVLDVAYLLNILSVPVLHLSCSALTSVCLIMNAVTILLLQTPRVPPQT